MRLWSNDFSDGGTIPGSCGYRHQNKRPHFAWDEVPKETKSFALICDDPDAPAGDWIHFIVHAIPSGIREIPTSSKVPGVILKNDFGIEAWSGPAPPMGTHRYFFTLYALDVSSLEHVHKNNFREQCENHKIESAQTMGTYTRK